MSVLVDTVLEYIDGAELTEGDAFELVFRLGDRLGWATAIWSMGDVAVLDEDGEELEGDERPELTDAMRFAVSSTYEWRKGINEIASERVAGMIPTITPHADGSFTMDASGEVTEWTADGGTP